MKSTKSKIIINNKTLVTFIGHDITPDFAKAWLKKKGIKDEKFYLFTEKDKITTNLLYTNK